MCGIAGIYGAVSKEKKTNALNSLSRQLAHRGPDGCKTYADDHVGFVHARLSIIDLTECGNQPLYNEDKTLVLVCNGELYNYKSLRAGLQQRGHTFSSNSDSEVILHLYEELSDTPEKLLELLTGMFAFALWDTQKKKLFIARDRIGIKPLYYYFDGGRFVFSSEVKPIALTGLFEPELDYTSMYEYFLMGSIPGPNTLFTQIKSLEPGHFLTVQDNKLTVREYWDIPLGLKKWKSDGEVADAVEELLVNVVKDHLVADVPVGTFLSAGVDSSLITAIAVGHHPGMHSFTASFPGEPEDEGVIAAQTAARLKTTHHSYAIKSSFFDDFSGQFQNIDQPFAIASALSLGRISRMARQDVKVVLSGDGGDELFGGYNRHAFPKVPAFLKVIPGALQNNVLKIGAKITGKQSLEKLRNSLKISEGQRFFDKVFVTQPDMALSFFAPNVIKHIDRERFLNRINRFFDKTQGEDKLNRVLYTDMKTTLIDEMLTKCDRMTMINGVEGRVPFLDHRLVELAFSIPSGYKRKDHIGKVPLRNILAKYLGNDIAFREKTGFNSPLKQWLRSDDATINFAQANIREAEKILFLNRDTLKNYAGGAGINNAVQVFAIVCFSEFYRSMGLMDKRV